MPSASHCGCVSLTAVRARVLRSTGLFGAGAWRAKLIRLATRDLVRRTYWPILAARGCCSGGERSAQQHVGIAQHGGDGIVEFVGGAADQLADRSQFFRLQDLRLQTLADCRTIPANGRASGSVPDPADAGARRPSRPMRNAATRVSASRKTRMRAGTAPSDMAQAANSGSENTAIMLQRATHTP